MAGPTVKEILLKWGIDNSNWKSAIQDLARLVEQQAAKADKVQEQSLKKLEAQKAKLKEIVDARKSETAHIEKQIEVMKLSAAAALTAKNEALAKVAAEKAAAAELQKQVVQQKLVFAEGQRSKVVAAEKVLLEKQAAAETLKQVAAQRVLQAAQLTLQKEITTKLMQERLVTAEINKQSAAVRLQAQQQRLAMGGGMGGRRPPTTAGGGGMMGGFLRGAGGALIGGGIGATIFAAVASAEAFGQALVGLTQKMEEFIKSTGPLQQVREQFEKLAVTSGRDPVKFMDDLRRATHGLVDDIALYRNANTFMQSGIKASQEEITQLTQATVGLARAQGRDAASAVQSLNRFFLTGRAMTLAYATGIQRTQLQIQGMGRSTDSATRATLAFKQAQETIVTQFKAIGEPALTFTDRLKQLEIAQHRFWEEIVIGITKSKGFQAFLEDMGKLAEKIAQVAEGAGGWGEKIGQVFVVLGEFGKYIYAQFEQVSTIIGALRDVVDSVFGPEIANNLLTFNGLLKTIAGTFILASGAAKTFGMVVAAGLKGGILGALSLKDEIKKVYQDTIDQLGALESKFGTDTKKRYSIQYAAPSNVYTEEQSMAAERKIAKAKEQIASESAKIELEQTQMRIKKEEELVQIQYEAGLLTIKGYLAKKADLELQDHNAKLKQLKAEFDAKMQYMDIEQSETRQLAEEKAQQAKDEADLRNAEIDQQKEQIRLRLLEDVKSGAINPRQAEGFAQKAADQAELLHKLVDSSRKSAERMASSETAELDAQKLVAKKKYYVDVLKEQENYQQKGRQLTEQDVRDEIAARKKLTEAIAALEKSRIEIAKENTEYEFQQGEIGAQEYLDKRVQYVEEEYKAVKDKADAELAANKNSQVAQAEFSQKMATAAETREKALTKLSLDEIDIRTKAVEQSYDRAQKLIESQIRFQQTIGKEDYFGGGKGEEQSLIENQIKLLKDRLEQEVKSLALTKEGTAQWFQQEEKIMATKEALVKYNEELIKAQDYASGLARAFKEMSGAAARFPKGGRVSAGLGVFAGGLEEMEQYRQRMAQRATLAEARKTGKEVAPVTPGEIFKSLQDVSKTAGEDIGKHLKAASDSVEEWRKKMVSSGVTLDDSIVRTTKALDDMTAALQRGAGAASGRKKYDSGIARVPGGAASGPSTVAEPLGMATASDMNKLAPAWLTSTMGGGGAGALAPATQAATVAMSRLGEVTKSLENSFQSFMKTSLGDDGLIGAFKSMGKDTQKAGEDLSNFADSVSQIAGNVGGLVAAGKGTGGPFQAGMQGLQSGMQLGMTVGGPIGSAIGAGVGLVMGVFSGKAKQEAEKLAKDIVAEFNAVLEGVQQGTVGLGSAVTQEITIIQQAVDQLSSKKGGRDELKQILPAMEQQLLQLQTQQQQVIKSFDATMEQISAPEASQALVQPVQAIIKTYQDYILAGGNVTTANEYLQASFKNLVTQGLDQLNQSEQDAINNALNYNNLLLQRQQLIQDTNQQIQDVMSQGVAVRQMPSGVTKARQLQQIELNAQTQLAQMDQEIAVSQHKLDNEQKIFGLATTRVGLETQLVALQDAQIDKQDSATTALLNEVAAFSGATPTNLPTAMGMLGLGGQYISPSAEPGLMPTPPIPTGIADIDKQNQLAYQQALAYYYQQVGLSASATIPSTTAGIPGGAQGVTVAGSGTTSTTSTTQYLGGVLDSLASNISAWPQAMQDMFTSASTIVNVGGDLLKSIATALGVSSVTAKPAQASAPTSNVMSIRIGTAVSDIQTSADSQVSAAQQRLVIEQNISSLSATRVQQETALVSLKMQEISADMQRIQAWSTLLNAPAVAGTQSQTMEDMLQNVYSTRARQGMGGFNGETSSPI